MDFYPEEIGIVLNQNFPDFQGIYYSKNDVYAFIDILRQKNNCIILRDQVNYMIEKMHQGPGNRLLRSISSSLRGIVSSSANYQLNASTKAELSKLHEVQCPIFQFCNK